MVGSTEFVEHQYNYQTTQQSNNQTTTPSLKYFAPNRIKKVAPEHSEIGNSFLGNYKDFINIA